MKIIITVPFTEEERARLRAQMPEAEYIFEEDPGNEELREAEIILGNVPVGRLAQAGKLKWLQLNSSGSDAYAKKGVIPESTLLTNATGAYGLAISEHLVGATFFLIKKLGYYYRNQSKAQWKDEGPVWASCGRLNRCHGSGASAGGPSPVEM